MSNTFIENNEKKTFPFASFTESVHKLKLSSGADDPGQLIYPAR